MKKINPNDGDSAQNEPDVMPPGTATGDDPQPEGPPKKPRKPRKKTKKI